MMNGDVSDLLRARALTLDALARLVGRGQLTGRLASAYRDSLSRIKSEADFPATAIDILAELDDALQHDQTEAIGEVAAERLAQNVTILLRELDAVLLRAT